ncbi:MAG: TonB-dependent receptor [Abitibacteriaceae bacterium]|nr:TonB-dependent receptor [Abditibacteriaceae bacterium]
MPVRAQGVDAQVDNPNQSNTTTDKSNTKPLPTAPGTDKPKQATPNPNTAQPDTTKTAPEVETMNEIVVTERSNNLVGTADSASQGTVGAQELKQRPILRPGELLETVPGVIISQHSGSGKANQYYLRGFNLDHGTDLAIFVDGMPVNMPTHAHGQGYSDLNFLIPELISGIEYRKGSYNADQGDFSAAGTINISYANRLTHGPAEVSLGNFGERRLLLTGEPANSKLIYGLELFHYDGPWVLPENYRKANGILRYVRGNEKNQLTLTGMGYNGNWNSTDQVPLRAINSGLIDRFGAIDPTDGGHSHRYSLSSQWRHQGHNATTNINAYAIDYKLNLFSDFTYFLDHPETNPPGMQGDQFEQADNRRVYGFTAAHTLTSRLGQRPMDNTFGFQLRYDDIKPVGLYDTEARQVFDIVRQDKVKETSAAPYFENRIRWTPHLRTTAGLRYDHYNFNVNSSIPANSGTAHDAIVSPKFGLAFGPFKKTDYYFNLAQGFHSNDARGTTISLDPTTRTPVGRVTPLVRANEAEIGVRTAAIKNLQSTLSLWTLKFDSELLFTGDAGTTEPSRPSQRNGIEFSNYYTPSRFVTVDADFAYSKARFTDQDPVGNHIPGAIEGVFAAGIAYEKPTGFLGSLRLRYFGPRPLIEDNSVRSKSSTLVNGRIGYKLRNNVRLGIDVFNIFNAKVSDIDYYYASRLPGEPKDGVNDVHTHPAESRSVRFGVTREF